MFVNADFVTRVGVVANRVEFRLDAGLEVRGQVDGKRQFDAALHALVAEMGGVGRDFQVRQDAEGKRPAVVAEKVVFEKQRQVAEAGLRA